jgi:hypothetical protein
VLETTAQPMHLPPLLLHPSIQMFIDHDMVIITGVLARVSPPSSSSSSLARTSATAYLHHHPDLVTMSSAHLPPWHPSLHFLTTTLPCSTANISQLNGCPPPPPSATSPHPL